jgi:predicted small secreted protein
MKLTRTPSFTNTLLVWTRLAWKTGEMMMASAQVIHHRTLRMTAAGATPSARDRPEFALMGQEKLEAGVESAQAHDVGRGGCHVARGKPHRRSGHGPAREARPHHDAVRGHYGATLRRRGPACPARAHPNTFTSDGQRQAVGGQAVAANACAVSLTGCNAMMSAGEDIERGGEKLRTHLSKCAPIGEARGIETKASTRQGARIARTWAKIRETPAGIVLGCIACCPTTEHPLADCGKPARTFASGSKTFPQYFPPNDDQSVWPHRRLSHR